MENIKSLALRAAAVASDSSEATKAIRGQFRKALHVMIDNGTLAEVTATYNELTDEGIKGSNDAKKAAKCLYAAVRSATNPKVVDRVNKTREKAREAMVAAGIDPATAQGMVPDLVTEHYTLTREGLQEFAAQYSFPADSLTRYAQHNQLTAEEIGLLQRILAAQTEEASA